MKSEKGHGHLDVPFRIVHGLIVTELRINHGQPTPFIFDTGSSGTLIDQEAARALGVKITSRRGPNIAGIGQCTYLPSFATKKIEIDSDKTEILHGELAAADLSGLRRLVPGLVGIIGYNLIRQHPFIFDYQRHIITIIANNNFHAPDGSNWIPLLSDKNSPIVVAKVVLQDKTLPDLKLLLDTGNDRQLIVGPAISQQHIPPNTPNLRHAAILGLTGLASYDEGLTGSLILDSSTMPISSFDFARSTCDRMANSDIDGSIGNQLLNKYSVLFDGSHNRVLLIGHNRTSTSDETETKR